MNKLKQKIFEKYHLIRISANTFNKREYADKIRDNIIEEHNLDIESFQIKYNNYIKLKYNSLK